MSIQLVSRARRAGLVDHGRARCSSIRRLRRWPALPALSRRRRRAARRCGRRLPGDADHALAAGARRADRSVQPGGAAAGAGGLQEEHLVAALQAVLDHHDALRLRVAAVGAAPTAVLRDRAVRRDRGGGLPAAHRCARIWMTTARRACIARGGAGRREQACSCGRGDAAGGVVRCRRGAGRAAAADDPSLVGRRGVVAHPGARSGGGLAGGCAGAGAGAAAARHLVPPLCATACGACAASGARPDELRVLDRDAERAGAVAGGRRA